MKYAIIHLGMPLDIFHQPQTKRLIDYVHEQYGDRLEFLWEKFPDNAVWRLPSNRKWYGVLLTVRRSKITQCSREAEMVEILDFRYDRDELPDFLRHQECICPGWHMNKDNWLTVILDESLSDAKIFNLLDNSREIAGQK